MKPLRYLIVGAGGTGGALGAHLAKGGADVTLIARGGHLSAMRENGLTLTRPSGTFTVPVRAFAEQEYLQLREEQRTDAEAGPGNGSGSRRGDVRTADPSAGRGGSEGVRRARDLKPRDPAGRASEIFLRLPAGRVRPLLWRTGRSDPERGGDPGLLRGTRPGDRASFGGDGVSAGGRPRAAEPRYSRQAGSGDDDVPAEGYRPRRPVGNRRADLFRCASGEGTGIYASAL